MGPEYLKFWQDPSLWMEWGVQDEKYWPNKHAASVFSGTVGFSYFLNQHSSRGDHGRCILITFCLGKPFMVSRF